MFGYKFEAGFVKKRNQKLPTQSYEPQGMSSEEVIRTAKGVIRELAIGVIATVGAVVVVNTISEIAVNRLGQPTQKELES